MILLKKDIDSDELKKIEEESQRQALAYITPIKEKLENARKTAEKAQAEAAAILERARITQEFVFAELDKAKKAKERADAAEAMENARGAIRRKLKESDEVVNPVNELKNDKNYSESTVINWEKGRTEPTVSQAMRIGEVVGIDYDDIIFLPQTTVKS